MAIILEIRNQKSEIGLSDIRHPTSGSRGFTLLIAAIFMSVMLTFGLALGSLGYKQQVLASLAIESQYAFYAANGALECALYADRQRGLFTYPSPYPSSPPSPAPTITCDTVPATFPVADGTVSYDADKWIVEERLSLDSGAHCADVVLYKYADGTTWIFSQGYDVPCATVASPSGARFVSRGISTHY